MCLENRLFSTNPLGGFNYCNPDDDNTGKSETVGFITVTIIFLHVVCSLVYYFNYCKYCNK